MKKVTLPLACVILFFSHQKTQAQDGMGIGNSNPLEMLDVTGAIKIGTDINNSTTAPSGGAGTVRFRNGVFEGWNGTVWVVLGSAGADADWTINGNDIHNANIGNVGIGTSSPVNLLHIQNNVSGLNFPLFLRNASINSGDGVGIGFLSEPNGDWTKAGVYYERTAGFGVGKLHFLVDDGSDNQSVTLAEARMTITPQGNVGIGTSSPSATLDVEGALQILDGNQGSGKVLTSDATGNATWQTPTVYDQAAFTTTSNVTRNEPGNYSSDDFVFGSPQLDYDADPNHASRMFFDKSKGAFRAGKTFDDEWDDASVGEYSVSFGFFTEASGHYSFAAGRANEASGSFSFAMGKESSATNHYTFASGLQANASGAASLALGSFVEASGDYSTAIGIRATASGNYSMASGLYTRAESYAEFVLGSYSAGYTPNSTTTWNGTDRIFVVGNGANSSSRSNAMVILKNGNVGIGESSPTQLLHLSGISGTDGITFPDGTTETTAFSGIPEGFTTTANRTSNAPGDYATDDFIFGSPQLNDDNDANHDARTFFDKSKGAFRAGKAIGTEWDNPNRGNVSVAMGLKTTASGDRSVALGNTTEAIGSEAFAMGFESIASGTRSVAFGTSTVASGTNSFATGYQTSASGNDGALATGNQTTASGTEAVAMGFQSTASGNRSAAFGTATVASGTNSLAAGFQSTASGNGGSIAIGNQTTASGFSSTAMGVSTTAESFGETTIGRYNTDYTPNSTNSWNVNDRLFVIGNGTGTGANSSNAIVVLKNGNVGIGESYPTQLLHLSGTSGTDGIKFPDGTTQITAYSGFGNTLDEAYDEGGPGIGRTITADNGSVKINGTDGLLVTGTLNSGTDVEANGTGTRMFFNPKTAAFRAGFVFGTQWNQSNLGDYSVAMGYQTEATGESTFAVGNNAEATGDNSTAMGYQTTASGNYSNSFGRETLASGENSTAMGYQTTASGDNSTAMGYLTTASGNYSNSFGRETLASGHHSIASGRETTASGAISTAIGYGTTASGSRSTALGISTTAPSYGELVIGRFNSITTADNILDWDNDDPIFQVGIGSSNSDRNNAMTILKDGNVGIGHANPKAALFIREDQAHNTKYPVEIVNLKNQGMTNSTFDYADGMKITAGHNEGLGTHRFISFFTPDDSPAGHIKQSLSGSVTYALTSDLRLKTNIVETQYGLAELLNIQVSDYNYKKSMHHLTTGFIAQQLYEYYPEAVSVGGENPAVDPWMVDYGRVTPLIVKSVQEQQEIIDAQRNLINQLLQRVDSLTERVETLEVE